jgi:hypothetical protein
MGPPRTTVTIDLARHDAKCPVMDDSLPCDPDLDDLPVELALATGPLRIGGVDRVTGEFFEAPITREQIASALAEKRRLAEDDDRG